ncbi:Ig-like domain-containing protein [Cohnella sp. CFH 77786]|uniref:Ig-like domain-containing protein n=1 Tax=Cohnella sp. CFH 77786 TaxID=2662265 RepID=UPI001C611137|nr:Ig-like domain-containing protein [Cohnella sp. CFH 77786]
MLFQRNLKLLVAFGVLCLAVLFTAHRQAAAEGSRELVSNGGNRPFLEWFPTGNISGIQRTTELFVYVKSGETINLGSNVHTSYDNKDIVLTSPSNQVQVLDVNASTGAGKISTVAQETSGPLPNAGGYTPLTVTAGEEGWWKVEFHGPASSGNPTTITTTAALPGGGDATGSGDSVAAWDVTIRDAGGVEKKGRMFTYSLALNMGSNGTSTTPVELKSKVYILTKDGYQYLTNMNGIDPFGFIFFSNNRGYIDGTNNKTLYHSVPLPLPGGITVQNPKSADTATAVTHRVFFNEPSSDLPASVPTTPIVPPTPVNPGFTNVAGTGPIAQVGQGGSFTFELARAATYQLIIDTNQDGVFDPSVDTLTENIASSGLNTFQWNGKNRSGVTVGVGEYKAKLLIKGGEYHFPLLDVEHAPNGVVIQMLNAPGAFPSGTSASTVYYDDSNYTTANGTAVNLDPSTGMSAANPRNASMGIDSTGGAHNYSGNYGNDKAMDTWTYFPGPTSIIKFSITDSTVSGVVFNDLDQDGMQDPGEQGIAGVKVQVTDSATQDGAYNGGTYTVTTDANGNYTLPIHAGNVTVKIDRSANPGLNGMASTTGGSEKSLIAVAGTNQVNFGYVTQPNQTPTATNATATTPVDTQLTGQLAGTDPDGDTLTYAKASDPVHGTLVVNVDGTYTYMPTPGYTGPDSFTFTVNDGTADSAPASVSITVTAENGVPTATNATATTPEGTPLTGQLAGTDADGDTLTYAKVSDPQHGTVVMSVYGSYTYTPEDGYTGPDSFTFTVTDGTMISDPGTVSITVTEPEYLEGWVGSRTLEDSTKTWTVAPGQPLKLSARTSLNATSVTASVYLDDQKFDTVTLKLANPGTFIQDGYKLWENVTYRLPDDVTAGSHLATYTAKQGDVVLPEEPSNRLDNNRFSVIKKINLSGTITDRDSSQPIAGAKVTLYDPTGTTKAAGIEPVITGADGKYSFPDIPTEQYRIVVEKQGYASQSRVVDTLPKDPNVTTITQDFQLVKYVLKLTANPSSIVGDGNSTSQLTAVLTDVNGVPQAGVPIRFTAPLGTFEDSDQTVVTDTDGKARIVYRSAQIEGIVSQSIPVTATADDSAKGLYAQEQIIVTFEPASIYGVITTIQNGTKVVVPGAVVKVTKDFNGDGVVDFAAEAVTDADGKYSIAVPRGDTNYEIEVTKPVQVGGETKELAFKQTVEVGPVNGAGGENFDSSKTASGYILTQLPNGQKKLFDDGNANEQNILGQLKVRIKDPATGNYITINGNSYFDFTNDGVFNVPGLVKDKDYELAVVYRVPDAQGNGPAKDIIVNALNNTGTLPTFRVTADGEMNILDALIDPYGDITDAITNAAIDGANVTLYYADTPRNVAGGITPHTVVTLPIIPGFAPNDNANPQTSRDGGKYAYMVYPTTDYYIVVTAPGYDSYTSPTIPVEFAIVRHDVKLNPRSGGSASTPATTPAPAVKPNLTVNLTSDRSSYEENSTATIVLDYINDGKASLKSGEVSVTLPEGALVIDADGGAVAGSKITWKVADLGVAQGAQHKIKVQWPTLTAAEKLVDVAAQGTSDSEFANPENARASLKLMLFSNRYGEVQHIRYILGYPDGKFHPERTLTRAELAAIIARLINGGGTNEKANYADVPANHWASGYIRIVTDNGIFTGFDDGTFRPDIPVTREQIAIVMVKYLKLKTPAPIRSNFADAQGRWSSSAVEALFRNGLITGYPEGTFKPGNSILRTEAVTLINRLLFRGPLTNVAPSFPDVQADHWAFGQVEEATQSHLSTRNVDGSEVFVKRIDDNVK